MCNHRIDIRGSIPRFCRGVRGDEKSHNRNCFKSNCFCLILFFVLISRYRRFFKKCEMGPILHFLESWARCEMMDQGCGFCCGFQRDIELLIWICIRHISIVWMRCSRFEIVMMMIMMKSSEKIFIVVLSCYQINHIIHFSSPSPSPFPVCFPYFRAVTFYTKKVFSFHAFESIFSASPDARYMIFLQFWILASIHFWKFRFLIINFAGFYHLFLSFVTDCSFQCKRTKYPDDGQRGAPGEGWMGPRSSSEQASKHAFLPRRSFP